MGTRAAQLTNHGSGDQGQSAQAHGKSEAAQGLPNRSRPEPAPVKRADVSKMSDNERYYEYMRRNERHMKKDAPNLGLPTSRVRTGRGV